MKQTRQRPDQGHQTRIGAFDFPSAGLIPSGFEDYMGEIVLSFGDLLQSDAFKRLDAITFLGVLSPKFSQELHSPIQAAFRGQKSKEDGSRLQHSLGVALITLKYARQLGWGQEEKIYALAWALLHDIATWPLSHTGEVAFARVTNLTSQELRRMIICSDTRLPQSFGLREILSGKGIRIPVLLSLFGHQDQESFQSLSKVKALLKSPLSPDAIEGVWRCSRIFSVSPPDPIELCNSVSQGFFDLEIRRELGPKIIKYWREKAKIYEKYINSHRVIKWESAWSDAIARAFEGTELSESLTLTESEVIERASAIGIRGDVGVMRYKTPLNYTVSPKKRRSFDKNVHIDDLSHILRKSVQTKRGKNMNLRLSELSQIVSEETLEVIKNAHEHSSKVLAGSKQAISSMLKEKSLKPKDFCFAAVGSIGRFEALEASDLDLIPIVKSKESLEAYTKVDPTLRANLSKILAIKVSQGKDLTRPVLIDELASIDCIGGELDSRDKLTQRILLMSESASAGGEYNLTDIRKEILSAYAKPERTVGRHPLAFCNDIARYYRTVCVDYKFKVDAVELDWCTRNAKLRNSRKFWYFSTVLAIAAITKRLRPDDKNFVNEMLEVLGNSPIDRLINAVPTVSRLAVGQALDHYAWYLKYMSNQQRRLALAEVQFDRRNDTELDNPYPAIQSNSKLMHRSFLGILELVEPEVKQRVLDWFLL